MTVHCQLSTLSRYLDSDLEHAEWSRVNAHLRTCGDCSRELARLKDADEALIRWAGTFSPIPMQTNARIIQSVEKHHTRSRFSLSSMVPAALGSTVAAFLVLISANVGLLQNEQPSTNRLPLPATTYHLQNRTPQVRHLATYSPLAVNRVVIQDVGRNQPPTVN